MVREYEASDLAAVVALFQRSVGEIASRDYTPAQIAAWAPKEPDTAVWASRLAEGGVFVCQRDDSITGFSRVDDEGYVDLLYVDPACQRRGVARELMTVVREWAVARGLQRLHAHVSITARPFFERMGFSVVRANRVERRGATLHNFSMELKL